MVDYETIVLDNASGKETKELLWKLYGQGMIDKLIFEKENTFFSRGNNLAANFCDKKSDYILLLNSDIEIMNPSWLQKMMVLHKQGITSLGISYTIQDNEEYCFYADGYCFLIDKNLYHRFQLNEEYEFFGALPELQLRVLNVGGRVMAVKDHESLIHHFGGKSGTDYKTAKRVDVKRDYNRKERKLFKKIEILYSLDKIVGKELSTANLIWGISSDSWCSPVSELELHTGPLGKIKIEGYYPFEITGRETLTFFVNQKKAGIYRIEEQTFRTSISGPVESLVNVKIKADFSYPAQPPDIRQLAFILSDIKGL